MKKIALMFSVCLLPSFLGAQTYSLKIYSSYYGELAVENLAEDAKPLELPINNAMEQTAGASDFSEIVLKAASPVKIFKKESQYASEHYVEKTSSKEFFVEPAGDGKSVVLTFKSSGNAVYTARNDKANNFSDTAPALNLKKKVRLNVPTLLYLKTTVATVNDVVPIWGEIPLLGSLFQSKGESRSRQLLWVMISEVKE